MTKDPGNCGERVLERSRERMFRGQAVFDPNDVCRQEVGELAAERLVDAEVADRPAAAM